MLLFSDAFPKQSVEAARALLKSPHLKHFLRRRLENGARLNAVFSTEWASIIAEAFGVSGLATAAIKGPEASPSVGGSNNTLYAC